MKYSFFFPVLFAIASLASCSEMSSYTRGIGVYPGTPSDYTGPTLVYAGDDYRNLAYGRAAWASSSVDYNHTAQLVTDGIISDSLPLLVKVETSDGQVVKNLTDLLFDGNDKRTMPLKGGKDAFVKVTFINGTIDCDEVILETDIEPVKVKRLSDNVFLADLSGKKVDSWNLKLMHFYKNGKEVPALTSETFTSCWVPETDGCQWIYVDLGTVCKFDKICLYWLEADTVFEGNMTDADKTWECNGVPMGSIDVSDDLVHWNEISTIPHGVSVDVDGCGRYVRVRMAPTFSSQPYMLSEFEIWGRGGLVAKPALQPKAKGGRLDLCGGNWKLQRSSLVAEDGDVLSTAGYNDAAWTVATVPGTVLNSYFNAGAIPDQRFSDDQKQISESFFLSDFWYRDEFDLPSSFAGKTVLLNFDGINWKADVWVNGTKAGRVEGAYTRGQFDVTSLLTPGKTNSLAVRIIRNNHPGRVKMQDAYTAETNGGVLGADNPTFHPTIGWDWIPTIRGRNIGIWNDVYLTAYDGGVSIDDVFITTDLPLPSIAYADIKPEITLVNHADHQVNGVLEVKFGPVSMCSELTLPACSKADYVIEPGRLDSPELWWPAGYGEPHLYDVEVSFRVGGKISDRKTLKSGVREMSYDDADGSLDIYVNGRRLIGNGGNWGFPEINLNYREREYDIAAAYHADMGFTLIRNWVGQTGDEEFYEACDRHGVMIWQDFWLANPWDGPDPLYEDLFIANAKDYIRRTRNHPCIALYCGRNEGMPPAAINTALAELVASSHPGSHYIPHSADITVSGFGPYRAIGPDAYFALEAGRSTLHSERGMPNVMSAESMRRMFRTEECWPQNDVWGVHDYTLGSAQHCDTFNGFIKQAFGEPKSLEQFAKWAQWVNYDGYRAMYESRSWERKGLLIWMSHSCWPSMVWQTYDYYFEPTAGYFGAKKGSAPIRIQFNPETGKIEVVNNCAGDMSSLTAELYVVDMYGNVLKTVSANLDSAEDTTVPVFDVPVVDIPTDVYYLKLVLRSEGQIVADNFYVRGKEYYNFKSLLSLPEAELEMVYSFKKSGSEYIGKAVVVNTGKTPALMLRLNLIGSKTGEQILPVFYQDNYFSLLPGESKSVELRFKVEDTRGEKPALTCTASL